jgi:glycine/D-amino acid oxidase-like deaminating enzyme
MKPSVKKKRLNKTMESTEKPNKNSYDIIIIGGAIYGSAIAWFLSNDSNFDGKILVIEKDPSYEFSSTARTNSCIRQQFSTKINIQISQFGADYINNFRTHMNGDPDIPILSIQNFGYMYLANTKEFAKILWENQKIQASENAGTKYMSAKEISYDYPFYNVEDIVAGNHNLKNEGYFDGNTIFSWWKKSAKKNKVEYIKNEVCSMNLNESKTNVNSIVLKSGEVIVCDKVINSAGPYASKVSRMAGIEIPVEPRKRYSFVFKAEKPLDRDLPLTVDPSGVTMRSDGQYYLAGCPPDYDPAVDYQDFTIDYSIWETKVWPRVVHRIPQFESIRLINSWVGHYAYNVLDQNAIVGYHSNVRNFIFANGFSGHGFQQSPAIGRGIAELITYNEFRSLDLAPFRFSRIEANEPFIETAII